MHATLDARRDWPRPAEAVRASPLAGRDAYSRGATWVCVGLLVCVVSLSMADSLLNGIIPYERDTSVFYYPLMAWVSDQLHQGHLPLWTPQFFGGYPLFADGEIGLAYPPALAALWLLPPDRALVALRWLHLCIGAIGGFALARAWRLPHTGAVLTGLVFSLGSFLQAQIHHENIIRTATWLPVILALVEYGLRSGPWRARVRWIVGAGGALGLAGLSLHAQILAIDLLGMAAYGILRWCVGPLPGSTAGWRSRLAVVVTILGAVVFLGLGLAAVQLVPLAELARFSARGSGIPYSESAAYSLTPYGLTQLIFPFVFRDEAGNQWGLWTHWESYLYVGLAPLLLAAVAVVCFRAREVVGWAAFAGVSLLLTLGQYSPLNLHYLLWLLPGVSGLRAPGRFSLLMMLAVGMLAAYGVAWLQSTANRQHIRRLADWIIALAVGLGVALLTVHSIVMNWPSETHAVIASTFLSLPRDSFALSGSDVYAGLVWATNLTNPRVAGALIGLVALGLTLRFWRSSQIFPAFTAIDLLIFSWSIHPRASLSELARLPTAVAAIQQSANPSQPPFRVLASPVLAQVAPDRLAPTGLEEADGYSSLQFVWHTDFIRRVLYADDDLLDLWNIRYLIEPARQGTFSSYEGVEFLPWQALLHAPADNALGDQRFQIAFSSPVTEINLVTAMMGTVDLPEGTPVAELRLRGPGEPAPVVWHGELLAGRDTMDWGWDLPTIRDKIGHNRVEVAGITFEGGVQPPSDRLLSFARIKLDQPVEATSLEIKAMPPTGELAIYGGRVVSAGGVSEQLIGSTKTKYREVYADDTLRVLENTAAFPRAFVIGRARVAESVGASLGQMVHRAFDPRREVILAPDAGADVTRRLPGDGEGIARMVTYSPERVEVHTSASADALLVLTDTLYPGWRAYVDGTEQPLFRGDLLFRVFPIPAGEHDVEFRFDPISIKAGLGVSASVLVIAVGVLIGTGIRRREAVEP